MLAVWGRLVVIGMKGKERVKGARLYHNFLNGDSYSP